MSIEGDGYEINWNNAIYLLDRSIPGWVTDKIGTLDDLADVLDDPRYTIDPTFEDYGNFLYQAEWLGENKIKYAGHWSLSGNFYNVSCAFGIRIEPHRTDLIERFRQLIDAQQNRPEYIQAKQELFDHDTWNGKCSCGCTELIVRTCRKCRRIYKRIKEE